MTFLVLSKSQQAKHEQIKTNATFAQNVLSFDFFCGFINPTISSNIPVERQRERKSYLIQLEWKEKVALFCLEAQS